MISSSMPIVWLPSTAGFLMYGVAGLLAFIKRPNLVACGRTSFRSSNFFKRLSVGKQAGDHTAGLCQAFGPSHHYRIAGPATAVRPDLLRGELRLSAGPGAHDAVRRARAYVQGGRRYVVDRGPSETPENRHSRNSTAAWRAVTPWRRMVRALQYYQSSHGNLAKNIQWVECPHAVRSIDSRWQSLGGGAKARANRGTRAAGRHRGDPEGDLELVDGPATRVRRDCGERRSPVRCLRRGDFSGGRQLPASRRASRAHTVP